MIIGGYIKSGLLMKVNERCGYSKQHFARSHWLFFFKCF